MKNVFYIVTLFTSLAFSQNSEDFEKARLKALQQSNNLVYEANELASDDYISAEMKYREALSKRSESVAGAYNLGNNYYNKNVYEEALFRYQEAAKKATSRSEKHKAFHNIGNILMRNEKCKEAVEAYKNALRNDPKDDESRYNLALAQECAKEEGDGDGEDENEDKKDQNKDQNEDENKEEQKEDEGEDKDKPEDEGDQEKKDGDEQEDKDGKPKEDKKDQQGEGDKKEQQKPQPKPGQLSPQQVKNLLEAMNDQELKVQEKINAKKQKGAKIKTDKDW